MFNIRWDKHTAILGTTDSGKTHFATYLFSTLQRPVKIFYNTAYEPIVHTRAEAVVKDQEALIAAINSEKRSICYDPEDNQLYALGNVRQVLEHLGKQICNIGVRKRWCALFIDEVHLWGGKTGDPIIDWFWTNGHRYGITTFGISQRPAKVSQTILSQSPYHVYFHMLEEERKYLRGYGFREDYIVPWTSQKFHFVVKKGTKYFRYPPVPVSNI